MAGIESSAQCDVPLVINGNLEICPSTTQTFSVDDIGFTSMAWYMNGELVSSTNVVEYTFTLPGVYNLQIEATTAECSYNQTESILVDAVTTFSPTFDFTTIHANFTAPSFTWYFEDQILAGVSGESYSPVNSGVYTIIANTGDPCPPSAQLFVNLCPPVPDIIGSDIACGLNPEYYSTTENGYPIVEWYFEDAFITTGGDVLLAFANPGTYTISLTVGNQFCTNTNSITVDAIAIPEVDVLDLNNGILESSVIGENYQWYFNGLPIANSNTVQITVTEQGNYSVEVNLASGCATESDPLFVDLLSVSENADALPFVYAIDQNQLLIQNKSNAHSTINTSIFGANGQLISTQQSTEQTFGIALSSLNSGVYFVHLSDDAGHQQNFRFALTR
jgi:Secretion system C-terminal sorting domain